MGREGARERVGTEDISVCRGHVLSATSNIKGGLNGDKGHPGALWPSWGEVAYGLTVGWALGL